MIAGQARLTKQIFKSNIATQSLALHRKPKPQTKLPAQQRIRTALAVEPIPYKKAQGKGRAINHHNIGSTALQQVSIAAAYTTLLRLDCTTDVEHRRRLLV